MQASVSGMIGKLPIAAGVAKAALFLAVLGVPGLAAQEPGVAQTGNLPDGSLLRVWTSHLESLSSLVLRETCEVERTSIPQSLGRHNQVMVWLVPGKERISYLFRTRQPDRNGNFSEKWSVFDLAWNGVLTADAAWSDPFRPRTVRLGEKPGVDLNLHERKAENPAASIWPVWVRPGIVPGRKRCGSFDEYFGLANSIVAAGMEEVSGKSARRIELTFPDQTEPGTSPITEIRHVWWLDPERGMAPWRLSMHYRERGVVFEPVWQVVAYHEDADSGFFYPQEYTIQFRDDEGGKGTRERGFYRTCTDRFEVDRPVEEAVFDGRPLAGVPVRVYGPDGQLKSAFVMTASGRREEVYDCAKVAPDDREQVVRDYVSTRSGNPDYAAEFRGIDWFDDPAAVQEKAGSGGSKGGGAQVPPQGVSSGDNGVQSQWRGWAVWVAVAGLLAVLAVACWKMVVRR